MNRKRVNQAITERCLLTEIAPYETPSLFSFWGCYNYVRNISANTAQPSYLKALFTPLGRDESIPFKYNIKKGVDSLRCLSVVHPKHSHQITDFYKHFETYITKVCRRSPYSIRAPVGIARSFRISEAESDELREIEETNADRIFASSYFTYNRFSYLYSFYDSEEFSELEKNYSKYLHVDIAKCFDSIYTHTISWAIKGRRVAKAQRGRSNKGDPLPFDKAFDDLLQGINYKETHGIPIGPELCRIFAEVILQRIDLNVATRLDAGGIYLNKSYCCHRYVDDILFFYNDDNDRKAFLKILNEELRVYKLHLNESKMVIFDRPFITPQSRFKMQVSEFISNFWDRLHRVKIRDSAKEIARLRASCPFGTVGFSAVAGLFFGSFRNQLRGFKVEDHKNAGDILYVVTDLIFHAFRMDTSASSSYKITGLILDILACMPKLREHERAKLNDKLIFELRGASVSAISHGYHVEAVNALIALRELKVDSALFTDFTRKILEFSRKAHLEEGGVKPRLNYFCIVGLLYFLKGNDAQLSQELVKDAIEILHKYNPSEYAESALLLLDLTACPFLSDDDKNRLIKVCITRHQPTANISDIGHFRNFVSQHTWFFNWNSGDNLRTHLRKKKLYPAYS